MKALSAKMPDEQRIIDLADTFKGLSDPTRLKIVIALSMKEICVNELSTLLNMSISAISHQLRVLKSMKIVRFRKDGKNVYYMLDDSHIENLIQEAARHISE